MRTLVVLALFVGFLQNGFVVESKECTNIPTQLSSHSLRYELLKSKNESWRAEMFSHYHLTPTDDSAWTSLLPRKLLSQESRDDDELEWSMMYRKMKNSGGIIDVGPGNFLREVSLQDVRLDSDSIHGKAQQTNLEYLLLLDSDSLVWSFRKTAGLSTPGKPYGGWEDPNTELRGHFVGHYLSASAQMWASTHNETLRAKMSEIVSALSACQDKMATGYLSAFPTELFDRFEAIKPVWAPYYTIHKVLAGLLDQYTLAGNEKALKMMTWMVDYFYKRVKSVITKHTVERHYLSLNEETGGMNDVLYKLYRITADPKHLLLAHLFDKPCFLGLLAVQADELSGFHSNTHIPIVIGAQMRYEVTGDQLYKEIGKFFMETVNSSHSYATGGTSVSEFWADPKRMASHLQTENEESCTTYNMLKVSRHLFRWTKEASYADYYERALTNGVLGIQRGTEPGVMIYMLPMGRGVSKAKSYHGWGTKFDSFWCCYGTGIESFSKLGDSIYFEERGDTPGLYVIQYISSSLAWKLGGLALSQRVEPVNSWDQNLRVTLRVSSVTGKGLLALNLRVPSWTRSIGARAKLNGKDLSLPPPGNFLSIARNWSPGDELTLNFPMSLRTEAIKDDRPEYGSIKAILYGPYLLAGHTNGDWDIESGSSDWITPVPSKHNNLLFTLSQSQGDSIFAVSNTNETLTMQKFPQLGTDSSLQATFRLVILTNSSSSPDPSFVEDIIGKPVAFEPMGFPGTAVAHRGQGTDLVVVVSDHSSSSSSTVFLVSRGLDQRNDTVSLESQSKRGCFVYSTSTDNGALKLSCDIGSSSEDSVKKAASFVMHRGTSKYHPLSFVAKGSSRNFLLAPLFSFMDESYTVYFNIGT